MSDSPKAPLVRKPIPGWKKFLLVASLAAFVVGAGLKGFAYFRGPNPTDPSRLSSDPSKKSTANFNNSLVDGGGQGAESRGSTNGDSSLDAENPEGASETLSPLLMHGGLSFFAGFCMAYAIRTFFKISAFFIGGVLLVFFALQYFNIIPAVKLDALQEHFQSLMASISHQLTGFKTFVAGHLPSSAAATAGVWTGWKKT